MRYVMVILIFLLFTCNCEHAEMQMNKAVQPISIPNITVLSTDHSLLLKNGIWYFKGSLFSGTIKSLYPSKKIKSIQGFFKGKEEGWLETFYPDGLHETKRYYHSGEKDSVHIGWWPNGHKRFEIHFSNGVYNGEYAEWYVDGNPLKTIQYVNGIDVSGKAFRNNGKPYMNFITKDGRRYGLLNSQMCYSLKNENGEFSKSTSDTLK